MFLQGKKILITGMISPRSIAYGVAKACKREGAELAFTYAADKLCDRVKSMAEELGSHLLYRCDVQNDEEIQSVFASLQQEWGHLDGLLHAVAFADKKALEGDFLGGISRENFLQAQEISAYSLPALAKGARPLMQGREGSIVALTYLGAVRAVQNYNTMGLAKASLEAAVRYTAQALGKEGIRCNGISAGPIKTLAAAGISGFSKSLKLSAAQSLLRRNITAEEVGNVAAFLFSPLSSAITGEIIYVDGGYSQAAFASEDLL
ncbi:MAG: enoyl-[acyl-carrier-protein] reductase FabI [Haemophilus parainfluenzae]|jgi:enoyl-[acyl-carrier-protein] reductase (NADH)|nr:MAG: enoyl-[acyl-carrier-protein] reductase FabI [Haemophilus parainfluenzae]